MRIILLGAPGVGKGTQAKGLASQLNILHISCGDLLRQAVKDGSELGREARVYMDKGELVPDNLVSRLVRERISQPDVKEGFILDGYPRNTSQAEELDKMLSGLKQELDTVIYLEAKQEVIIQRLTGRRLCSQCQANFHIKNMPPKREGICDYCGGKLYQRADDNEETIKKRLKVYQQEIFSLIEYYRKKNKLMPIAADEEADIVLRAILEKLNGKFKITSGS
jgi:adenylate kinase